MSPIPRREFVLGDAGSLGTRARAWLAGTPTDLPAAAHPAATVMLVRDAADGVEVFMLRRVASMAFAPSMWVFPGGGVDPRDDAPGVPWAGPAPAQWAELLGCDEGLARALVSAAVREVFEECGVLLAGPSGESVVADLRDPEWDREREALLDRRQSLSELLLRRGLVLRSDLLSARARWVTPEFEPKRYDTWFFAALLPEGQIPDDLTSEADHADWTAPAALLAQQEAGAALMLPPTIVAVEDVARARSAAAFVAEAGATRAVLPTLLERDGRAIISVDLP
ncbi:MAG: NUDIX domain-containing protein [Actinomycetota bacterium]|nr:NUDIX domain-containing protein [Actinomycetota bacterium]